MVLSFPVSVLGTESGTSAKAVCVLNHRAISFSFFPQWFSVCVHQYMGLCVCRDMHLHMQRLKQGGTSSRGAGVTVGELVCYMDAGIQNSVIMSAVSNLNS